MLTFPGVILPAFVGLALLLAVLRPNLSWRYRDILVVVCVVLAAYCALPRPRGEAAAKSEPAIEVDMLVSGGNMVELWVNDWQHPSEQLPVMAGERHVYRFKKVPGDITLLRLDPTEQPGARGVIYSLAVKAGDRILQQFGPAELRNWTLVNLAAPKEENGGLELADTNDDPILWTSLRTPLHLPEDRSPAPAWLRWLGIYWPFLALLAGGLALLLARRSPLLSRPCPDWGGWAGRRPALLLAALLAAGVVVYVHSQNAGLETSIEVDMLVSRGNAVELYFNDWHQPPVRLPVIAGQRHVYRFDNLPQQITRIRLDPTDLPDARVIIYSLTVKMPNQVLRQFGPEELKHWTLVNLSTPKEEDGGLALDDTNNDPLLWTPLELPVPGSRLQVMAAALIETPDAPFLLAITAFLLVLLGRMFTRTGRMQALLIAVAIGMAFPVVLPVMKLRLPLLPVTATVGYANYIGYPKAHDYLAALTLMLLCMGLSYVFARLAGDGQEEPEETVAASRQSKVRITIAAVFGMVFVYYLPSLTGALQDLRQTVYQKHLWDDTNWLLWAFMVNAGLRPLRDFWFPYSGSYLSLLPGPAGWLAGVAHCTLVLGVLFLALLKATGRKLAHALAIFGLIAIPVLLDMLPGWNRYLLAVDVALLCVVVGDSARLEWKKHAPFAVFVGYVFFYEPTQLVYSGAGIGLHIMAMALNRFHGRSVRERLAASAQVLKQRLVCVGIPMLAGVAAGSLVFAMNGMLPGLWDFEMSLGDQGNYAAVPADVGRWVLPVLQPETVFLLMFLLASYTVYRWVRMKGRPDPLGAILVALSGTAFMAMQKQLLRPHVMTQLRVYPYVALLIFGLIAWRERKPVSRVIIAAFLGCILGIAVSRGAVWAIYTQGVETAPAKVASSIDALLHHAKEFEQVDSTLYSRFRFQGFDAQNAVVDNLIQNCGLRDEESVYVLGDESIFYILLNKYPPYISNSYNDSPIYEQQKVLDWFERKRPRFVIWAPGDAIYDAVPHVVRLPLIYTYVIGHYELLREMGPYQILAERPPNRPPDLGYWRRMLGDRVDLGHIPGRARLAEYAACDGEVARCDAVLVVRYPPSSPVAKGKLTVDIEAPGGLFRAQFDVAPEEREYVVNLNRLWFWRLLADSGAPRITAEDAAAEAAMDYRRERSPVLY